MKNDTHRILWLLLAGTLSSQAMAIDIGAMTIAMAPNEEFIARTVTNNSGSPKVYEVQMEKISNPTATGTSVPTVPGELLFAPKRFTLHAKRMQNVKLYYKGPADGQERYYRITFTESPAAQFDESGQARRRGALEMRLALQSTLVVRPRQVVFDYQLNEGNQMIINSGNTYFEFMVKQGCEQPDSDATSKYLLPGERWHNNSIGKQGNQYMIIYQNKFIPIGKACK
ncbi:fimbria/pilus periplasmic chaperone [Aeromonas hydrophila]|uniref:fimbria/pilus periplasmic chaperone n=1 Tax=Aeromonas hydrophila TaxID=644 RepID=UPI00207D1725|nr:fimbria/pilus periplasmic chaperone [Aeromonas hydrophila]MCO4213748.1 fimbria/pilus periplasmic chaperone [Aeromonas hydrophila]HDX8444584.1 molecular chaperone [Aeromonas hydrophila]HDX8635683.1 molecular chaperone [Aeromonas hydrophila]